MFIYIVSFSQFSSFVNDYKYMVILPTAPMAIETPSIPIVYKITDTFFCINTCRSILLRTTFLST